jgi:hypothetical protein
MPVSMTASSTPLPVTPNACGPSEDEDAQTYRAFVIQVVSSIPSRYLRLG